MYQTPGNGESVNRRDGLAQPQLPAWKSLKQAVQQVWPTHNFANVTVLVGVSGGADSVCLLRLLHDFSTKNSADATNRTPSQPSRGRLVVGHYNHKLRGSESDADAEFVQLLADSLNLMCCVGIAQAPGSISVASEESLRNQRYDFFLETAARLGARYVALAHTANDCLETVLHHLFRGSGPAGLSGIPPFRSLGSDLVIARPLLRVSREQIQAGLEEIDQPHRHDKSNDTDQWNRNWLRNVLLPLVRQRYPQADQSILRASGLIASQNEDLQQLADLYFDDFFAVFENGFQVRSPIGSAAQQSRLPTKLAPQSVFVAAAVRAWNQLGWPRGDMSQKHWQDLWQAVVARTPVSLNLPGNIRAMAKTDGSVVVERSTSD